MVEIPTSIREWWAEVEPFVVRQFDHVLSYLREIDTSSRLITFLAATIFCHILLEGSGARSAH